MSFQIPKIMESESIKARVRVAFKELPDKPYLYTTDLSAIYDLGFKHDTKWGSTHVGINDIIHIEGIAYRIDKIYTSFNDENFKTDSSRRDNTYSYGEMYPFNLDITYEVEEVK